MKKHLLTTTAAGAALALTSSAAMAGNYVTIFGGYSMADDTLKAHVTRTGSFGSYSYTSTYATFSHSHTASSSFLFSHILYRSTVTYRSTSGTFYSATDFDLSTDSGFVIGAAAGYDMGNGMNFEIELAYRKQDADAKKMFSFSSAYSGSTWQHFHSSRVRYYTSPTEVVADTGPFSTPTTSGSIIIPAGSFLSTTASAVPVSGGTAYTTTTAATGDIRSISIMANVWFDLGGGQGGWHPYIGGGVGMADVTLDVAPISDSSDRGFAYQLGAGIGWEMPDSNSRINLEYRYFAVNDLEFVQGPNTFNYDYQVSEILIGFRMNY